MEILNKFGIFCSLFLGYASLTSLRKPLTILYSVVKVEIGISTAELGSVNSAFYTAYGISKFLGAIAAETVTVKIKFHTACKMIFSDKRNFYSESSYIFNTITSKKECIKFFLRCRVIFCLVDVFY